MLFMHVLRSVVVKKPLFCLNVDGAQRMSAICHGFRHFSYRVRADPHCVALCLTRFGNEFSHSPMELFLC